MFHGVPLLSSMKFGVFIAISSRRCPACFNAEAMRDLPMAASMTSSMRSAMTNFSFLRTMGSISSRSFLFWLGMMTVLMPDLAAASVFSFRPPMGRTSPRSVISPVIAMSGLSGMSRSKLTIAVYIAQPADGPSLGTAPAGTWMCKSILFSRLGSMPNFAMRVLKRLTAAVADSFITSPSCPVSVTLPDPAYAVASMNRMSPPTEVYAKPMTTPGNFVLRLISYSYFSTPR